MFNFSTWTIPQRRFALITIVLTLMFGWLYLAGHDRYGLFDVDEAIFTQATIEMRANGGADGVGGLAMPTYNGEPRYHKPPLIYWMQDAAMGVLGEDSLYAARLPSALAALASIFMLGYGVWRLTYNRRWALASAAALGLNLSFLVVGRAATADGLLNFLSLALALWMLVLLYGIKARGRRVKKGEQDWIVTGTLGAFGFLAKGPVAWIPAMTIAIAVWAVRKDRKAVWDSLEIGKSSLVMAAILVPWMALLVSTHGLAFFYEFFVVHNIGRYAGGLSNSQSSYGIYYLLVLMLGFFPWVLVLPKAIPAAFKKWRKYIAGTDLTRALPPLAAIWAIFYVVFFSASQTKLAHYIVPAYPALAILVGWWLTLVPRPKINGWWIMAGAAWALVLAGIFIIANPLLVGLREEVLRGWLGWAQVVLNFKWPPKDALAFAVLSEPVGLGYGLPVVGGLLLGLVVPLWVMVARDVRGALTGLWIVWAAVLMVIMWGVVPVVWTYTQSPLARLAVLMNDFPKETPVVHLGLHKPSVRYISGRPFTKLEKPLQLPEYVARAPETLVLTEEPTVPKIQMELAAQARGMILGQACEGGYCLLIVGHGDGLPH